MEIRGERPDHWDEELAFVYELRFVKEPTDKQCAALATVWATHCADKKSPASAGAWTFSREYAFLTAFPRVEDQRKLFRHVATFIRKVHETVPLKEAVHLTAGEDYSGLDPGPKHPGSQRAVVKKYPAPAPREAFDEAMRGHARAEQMARFAKLVVAPPAGNVGLAICDPVPAPKPSDYPKALRALYSDTDGMRFDGAATRPRRIRDAGAVEQDSITLVVKGKPKKIALPDGFSTYAISSPSGDAATIAFAGWSDRSYAVLLADPRTATTRVGWTAPAGEKISTVAWLTDGHLVVGTDKRILAIALSETGEAEVVATLSGGRPFQVCLDGRLLCLTNQGFVAWTGSSLVPVSKLKPDRMYFVSDAGGRVVVRHGHDGMRADEDDTYFEVTHLDVIEKAIEKAAKAKPKGKAATKTKTGASASKAGGARWESVRGVKKPAPLTDTEDKPLDRNEWSHPGDVFDTHLRWGPDVNPTTLRAPEAKDVIAMLCCEGVALKSGKRLHCVEVFKPARLAISPKGTRAYSLSSEQYINAFTLDSDERDFMVDCEDEGAGKIGDFAAVGEDELVIAGLKGVLWMGREDDEWVVLARDPSFKKCTRAVALDGRVAILCAGANPLVVVEREGKKIRKLVVDATGADDLFVADGKLCAVRPGGDVVALTI